MLEEAGDVLRRYDQLLPVENRGYALPFALVVYFFALNAHLEPMADRLVSLVNA
jgi:hypothetical protein